MPVASISTIPAVSPKLWKSGSAETARSVGPIGARACSWATLARRLPCVSTTPFGAPSVPEVKSTAASVSRRRSRGVNRAATNAASLSKRVTAAFRSSVQSRSKPAASHRFHQLAEAALVDEGAA